MSFLFKFGAQITLVCACMSCLAFSYNIGMYINNIYVKKTGETDTTKAEKYMAMIFCCLTCWEMLGHWIFSLIS